MASYFRKVPNFEYVSRNKGEQNISDYVEVKNLFKKGKIREDIFGNLAFFEKYQIIGDDRPDNVAFKIYEDETLDWVVLLSNNILNIQTEWPLSQDVFDSVMLERYGSYDNLYSGVHHYETVEIKNSLGKTVLPSGIRTPLSWKTNGNFLEIINSKIDTLVGSASTTSVTVTMSNGILGLEENDQVTIDGVAEKQYNGQYIVTGITSISSDIVYGFTYDLPSIPSVISPTLSTPRKEEVHYTVSEESLNPGNSYYYEYWDEGLGYSVQVPSTAFVRTVTNYEYELEINEAKRGIYVLKAKYLNVLFNDIDTIMPYKKGGTQYVSPTLKRADNIKLYE